MVVVLGKVSVIGKELTFPNTDFRKKNLILETLETNTPYSVDFSNDKIDLLKDVSVGDFVRVEYYVRGNYDKKKPEVAYNSFEGKSLKDIIIQE